MRWRCDGKLLTNSPTSAFYTEWREMLPVKRNSAVVSRCKESSVDEVKLVVIHEEIFDVLVSPRRVAAQL